ncbi:MAG: hypothetical protein ACREH3_01840, partial [Geminicoccales bacterium]
VQQALENPEGVKKQIEQLGGSADQAKDALKELRKDPKKLLEGLTGGGSGDEGGQPEQQEAPAQQLLKGLFGR